MSDYPEVTYKGHIWTVEKRLGGTLLRKPGGICWVTSDEVEQLQRRKVGKPRGKYGLLNDHQLHVFHAAHIRGKSIRELGRENWKEIGAASPHSAAAAISNGFKRLGLEARLKTVATAAVNRKRRAPDSPGTGDRKVYKRYLLEKAGRRRRCEGKRTQPPRKGSQCDGWAMNDSDFCPGHDPRLQETNAVNLERARKVRAMA